MFSIDYNGNFFGYCQNLPMDFLSGGYGKLTQCKKDANPSGLASFCYQLLFCGLYRFAAD
ncbi:hypothetical protein D3Z39_04910 [Anaerotruncus colihominis]|uniref:Uncharacterized protein n=1 Tax=Anaerotruncus colihominis TaxID=169435 RepID=A0A845RDK1_9FIRM|nr:hypothetical protein [Anaerotruncus colihominis]